MSTPRLHYSDGPSQADSMIATAQKSAVVSSDYFDFIQASKEKTKNKKAFRDAIDLYNRRNLRKRGVVEFIRAALKHIERLGLQNDLDVYKELIDTMPKGKYVPTNQFQASFHYHPKHNDCGLDLMQMMSFHGVIPDHEFGCIIENVFGIKSVCMKKYSRMIYWMPKFKNLDPFLLSKLPEGNLDLGTLAIERIMSVDNLSEIKVYNSEEIPESIDKTWIVSGMAPTQSQTLIPSWPKNSALFVEGGFRIWLGEHQVTYFILRGAPIPPPPQPKGNIDDVEKGYKMWMYGEKDPDVSVERIPTVHEMEDGTILAVCATGTSSKDSLLSWIRFLQRDNPALENIPILFSLSSPLGSVVPVEDVGSNISK